MRKVTGSNPVRPTMCFVLYVCAKRFIKYQYSAYSLRLLRCPKTLRNHIGTIVSSGYSRTYYNCPRCLTKVGDVKTSKHVKGMEEEKAPTVVVHKSGESDSEEVKCGHFFGYLRMRPKNTPIPDECLTCNRMIGCLTY